MPDPRLLEIARTANDALADASIRHAIFLERYKTHVINGVIGSLNPEYDRVVDRTFAVFGRIKSRGLGVRVDQLKQLQDLVEANGKTLTGAYRAAVRSVYRELQDFAAQEAAWQIDQINRASPVEFTLRTPDPGVFRAIVTAEPFGDPTRGVVRTLQEWMQVESASVTAQIKGALDVALRQGDTVDQAVRRIAGPRGIIQRSREHVATWVRTASANTSALAREATAKENEDVVKGMRFLATLDSHTCFPAGTMVTLWGGERAPIETLSPGDYVVSGSGKRRRVNALVEKTGRDWRTIVLSNGERIRATATHLFWCRRRSGVGWVAASEIHNGDLLGVRQAGSAPEEALLLDGVPVGRHEAAHDSEVRAMRQAVRVPRIEAEEVLLSQVLLRRPGLAGSDVRVVQEVVSSSRLLREEGRQRGELLHTGLLGRCAAGWPSAGCDGRHMRDLWQGVPVPAACGQGGQAAAALLETVQLPPHGHQLCDLRQGVHSLDSLQAQATLLGGLLPRIDWRDLPGEDGARGDRSGRAALRAGGANGPQLDRLRSERVAGDRDGRELLALGEARETEGASPQGEAHCCCGVHADAVRGAAGDAGGQGAVQGRTCHGNEPAAEGWAAVVAVETDQRPEPCYDIEVEGDHCFLVGESGVIAHNTETCATLDGQVFEVGDGPRPPMHPNCRSTMTYVLKSWKELGIPLKEAPPGTRESLNGQVPADLKFPTWFQQQPAAFQREYLGPGRYELYKSGRLDFRRLVDNQHRPLTLAQLRDRTGLEAA